MSLDLETIGIAFDTSGLVNGQRALKDTETAANKTADAADAAGKKGSKGLSDFGTAADIAKRQTESLAGATDVLSKAIDLAAKAYAAFKVYEYIKDATLLNARYETLGVSMTVVGKNAGYTASQMEEAALALQKTGISMIESRQQAMRLVQAHIDLKDSSKLARIAQDAAVIGNMNSSEAFATLVHGIQTAQTETLRTIGINVSMEQSYKSYAKELHKTAEQLTQNEKTQAILNAVIAAGSDIAGVYSASMDTAGKQLNSMKRYTEDLKTMQGEVFNEVLTVAVMAYTEHLKDANGEISELAKNGELKAWGESLTDVFVGIANTINNIIVMTKLAAVETAHLTEKGGLGYAPDDAGSLQKLGAKLFAAMGADSSAPTNSSVKTYEEEIAKISKELDKFDRALEERRKANVEKTAKTHAEAIAKEQDYYTKVLEIQKAYAGYSLDIQRSAQQQLAQSYFGDNHKYKDTAPTGKSSISKEESAYQSLSKAIREKLALSALELNSEKPLTEAQKNRVKIMELLENSHGKIAKARVLELTKQNDLIRANELMKGSYEGLRKELEKYKPALTAKDITDEIQKQDNAYSGILKSQSEYGQSLQDNTDLMQLEISFMGQSATARNTAIEQFKIQIALEKELQKIKENSWLSESRKQELSDNAKANADIAKSQAGLKAQQQEWSRFYGEIYTGLYDSLYRGFEAGKGFGKSLWDSTQNLFKTNAIKVVLQGVVTSVSGTVSNIAQAMSSDGSGSSGMGGNSLLSMGKSIYEGFSGGFSGFGNSVANYVQAGLDKAGLSMTGGGNSAFASGAGTAASYAGGAAVGIYGGRAISGGYSVTGGNAAVNIGTAIGAIWGPIGMAIGGAIGGLVNRAFGRKAAELQQSEMSGSFGESGFTGNLRDVYKAEGGWFSGDKWSEKNNAISDTKSLSDAFAAIKSSSLGYASILGLSADAVNNFTKDFKVNLSITGDAAKDAEANKKIMTDLLVSVANDMSNSLAPSLRQFAREGEQASDTLARLSNSLLTVNGIMNAAGFVEFDKSLEGAKAAERLAELAGGIEKLALGTQYFTENFLTDAEKIKPSADLVLSTMTKLGQASVDTVEEFKLLVQGLDRSSQAGAEMYAQLISIAPQFKSVADYAKEAAKQTESYVDVQFNAQRKVEAAAIAATQALEAQAKATAAATRAEAQKAYDDNLQSRLRSGKVGEIMSSNYALNPIDMLAYVGDGQFDAAGFNSELIRQRAKVAIDLANKASADAINVEDITSVLSSLFDFTKDREFENELRRSLPANARNQVSQTVGYIFSDFIDASITGIRLNEFTSRGQGIASVIAAQEDLQYQTDLQTGYSRSLSSANAMLHLGIITQEQYQSALSDANKILADNVRSQESLNDAIKQAGIDSTAFYFNQIGLSVERLNQAAEKAAEPLAVVTSAIGRFTSISDVFGMSARAAGDVGGNADLVAQSAKIAAQVLTTQSAAQAAKELAGKASFSGQSASQLRDFSLLIEGVKQFDPNSFESGFLRISDALNKGTIDQAQYQDLFSASLDMFNGVESESSLLAKTMGDLRASMRGFADSLLIDKSKTTLSDSARMQEVMRQYDAAKIGAMTGDASSISLFQSLGSQLASKENYSSRAEANYGFSRVLADSQSLVRYADQKTSGEKQTAAIQSMEKSMNERMDKQFAIMLAQLKELQDSNVNQVRASLPA